MEENKSIEFSGYKVWMYSNAHIFIKDITRGVLPPTNSCSCSSSSKGFGSASDMSIMSSNNLPIFLPLIFNL